MVGWRPQLNEPEFVQTPGDDEGQGCLGVLPPMRLQSWAQPNDWTTTDQPHLRPRVPHPPHFLVSLYVRILRFLPHNPDTGSPLIPLDNLVKETVLAPSYRSSLRDSVLISPIKCQSQCGLRRPSWCPRAAKPQHLACCWDSGALGHSSPHPPTTAPSSFNKPVPAPLVLQPGMLSPPLHTS